MTATHHDDRDEDVYLTTGEAAGLLQVNSKTVGRYVKEGRLTNVRVMHTLGGHVRVHEGDLRALVATLGHGPGDAE